MASGYGKKKTLKEKANSAFKKLIAVSVLAGVAAVPGMYHYGTIHEQEVKINDIKTIWLGYDKEKQEYNKEKKIYSSIGQLENKNSWLHLKFNASDIDNQWQSNQTYRIKYYGKRFSSSIGGIDLYPNILKAELVTEQELQARAAAAKAKQEEQARQAQGGKVTPGVQSAADKTVQSGVVPAATDAAVQTGLSGEVTTIVRVVNGTRIQMIVPVEAADEVKVTSVTAVKPAPRPAPPPAPGS